MLPAFDFPVIDTTFESFRILQPWPFDRLYIENKEKTWNFEIPKSFHFIRTVINNRPLVIIPQKIFTIILNFDPEPSPINPGWTHQVYPGLYIYHDTSFVYMYHREHLYIYDGIYNLKITRPTAFTICSSAHLHYNLCTDGESLYMIRYDMKTRETEILNKITSVRMCCLNTTRYISFLSKNTWKTYHVETGEMVDFFLTPDIIHSKKSFLALSNDHKYNLNLPPHWLRPNLMTYWSLDQRILHLQIEDRIQSFCCPEMRNCKYTDLAHKNYILVLFLLIRAPCRTLGSKSITFYLPKALFIDKILPLLF